MLIAEAKETVGPRSVDTDTRWQRGMGATEIEEVEHIPDEGQNTSCSSNLFLVLRSRFFHVLDATPANCVYTRITLLE